MEIERRRRERQGVRMAKVEEEREVEVAACEWGEMPAGSNGSSPPIKHEHVSAGSADASISGAFFRGVGMALSSRFVETQTAPRAALGKCIWAWSLRARFGVRRLGPGTNPKSETAPNASSKP